MGDLGGPPGTAVIREHVSVATRQDEPLSLASRVGRLRAGLAGLFASAEKTRPITPRAVVAAIAAVVAATAVCLLRIRGANGASPLNVLWAEDGSNFLTDAYLYPPLHNLVSPINGYHLLYGRILAEVASVFPVAWGAGVLITLSAASSAVMGLIVFVASGRVLPHPLARVVAGLCIIVTPLAYGMANQVAPLHFVMVYAAFWCLMWTPQSRTGRLVQFALLLLTALSTILAVFLLPLAALRVWACWDRYSAMLSGAMIPGLVLQAVSLATGTASRGDISEPRLDPIWAVKAFVTWALPFGFAGDNTLRFLPQTSPGYYTGGGTGESYWLALLASWALVGAVVLVAARRITRPNWLFAAVALGQALIFFAGQVMVDGHLVMRYIYTPLLFVVVAICALLLPHQAAATTSSVTAEPVDTLRRLAPMVSFALLLAVACVVNFRSIGDGRPAWDAALRSAQADCEDSSARTGLARLGRSGWAVVVPCERLR